MTRGEVPDIPARQKLGVRSLGAHEQEVRRDFQIRQLAFYRGIDSETFENNATVRRYVSVLRDVDAAGERLGTYSAREFMRDSHPHAYERVGQAATLCGAEKLILEEGFREEAVPSDPTRGYPLHERLSDVTEGYGLWVTYTDRLWRRYWDEPLETNIEGPQPDPVRGIWSSPRDFDGPQDPWDRVDADNRFWDLPDWPDERHDREHMRALAAEAAVQGVDPDRPRTDPVMHTLLTGIVYGRGLVRATEDVEGLPPAPGMTPPAQERLRRVAPLNRLAVSVLEDAVQPGTLTQEQVIVELAPVLVAYELRFESSAAEG